MLDVFRFWMELAQTDSAWMCSMPISGSPAAGQSAKFGLRAFDRQRHIHDMDQPEMMPFLNELRSLLDSYPERYAVGETYLATLPKTISTVEGQAACCIQFRFHCE